MNTITNKIKTGTIGELLVQIRLLQYGIQAAPPLKDSGNDLIAVNGSVFRAISVRTTTNGTFNKPNPARQFHILAVVHLVGLNRNINLDSSNIFLIPKEAVESVSSNCTNLEKFKLSQASIANFFNQICE